MRKRKTYESIETLLDEVPGQSVKELAAKLGDDRNVVSGYLRALEDLGYVSSRRVGPARVYYKLRSFRVEGPTEDSEVVKHRKNS